MGNRLARTAIVLAALSLPFIGWTATAAAQEPIAADTNGPQAILDGFLSGIAGAFGSSGSKPQPSPQSVIYPDFNSCNREANRLRQPGVTAECNPVGGAGGQYQLIYIPRG